jgi:hypothetical protein
MRTSASCAFWRASLVAVTIAACSRGSSHDSAAPTASIRAPGAASIASAAPPGPIPSGSAATGPTIQSATWSGSYAAKVGAVEPPENAKEKTWTQDPGSAAVGKGTVDLSVGERGETRGETKGPLGEMTITGLYDGKELRANLLPKDPRADGAMTGFMVLSSEGDSLKGTIRVSNRDARIVREATVELAKK